MSGEPGARAGSGARKSETRVTSRVVLEVPGPPVGKERPRFGRNGAVYTPSRTVVMESNVRAAWLASGKPMLRDDRAVALAVLVMVVRPRSHFRRDGRLSAEGARHPIPRSQKPDADNVVKLVCDALCGLAYTDDVRVASLAVLRCWAERPGLIVTVEEMGGDE